MKQFEVKSSLQSLPYAIIQYIVIQDKQQKSPLKNIKVKFFIRPSIQKTQNQKDIKNKPQQLDSKELLSRLEIQIEDPDKFLTEIEGQIAEAKQIDEFIRKISNDNKKNLKEHQIEYNYVEPESQRYFTVQNELKSENNQQLNKYTHYSLAFQGGGAKGLAYVGVYEALRENAKIQPKSIIGSSAGGIFALAVSTKITPNDLLSVCYTMNQIPSQDRIEPDALTWANQDRFPNKNRSQAERQVKEAIQKLIEDHGVIKKDLSDFIFKNIFTDSVLKKMAEYFACGSESMGQIFKPLTGDNLNYYGLILEGALMKGEAIENVAAQCLSKCICKAYAEEEQRYKLQECFVSYKWNTLEKVIKEDIQAYDDLQRLKLSEVWDVLGMKPQREKNKMGELNIINRIIFYFKNKLKEFNDCNKHAYLYMSIRGLVKVLKQFFVFKNKISEKEPKKLSLIEYFNLNVFENKSIAGHKYREQAQSIKSLADYTKGTMETFFFNSDYVQISEIKDMNSSTLYSLFKSILSSEDVICKRKQEIPNQMATDYIGSFKRKDSVYWEQICDILADNMIIFVANIDQGLKYLSQKCPKIVNKIEKTEQKLKAIKTINLSEYYAFNGTQLTCTSVDLNDRTMRLFNHKTTPYLPVCKAVQMTGSFPFGFKAQKWRSEWGKYYVHYERTRRQIDLVGHEFTDGGMFANFPIKYLDNQQMRTQYFSHTSTGSKFLGFGLDKIPDENYYKNEEETKITSEKNHKKSMALISLMTEIKKNFTVWGALKNIGWSDATETVEINKKFKKQIFDTIQKIPFIRFMIKLITAYPNADKNLNMECFATKIINHDLHQIKHNFQTEHDNNQLLEEIQNWPEIKARRSSLEKLMSELDLRFKNSENPLVNWSNLSNEESSMFREEFQNLIKQENKHPEMMISNYEFVAKRGFIKCLDYFMIGNLGKLKEAYEKEKREIESRGNMKAENLELEIFRNLSKGWSDGHDEENGEFLRKINFILENFRKETGSHQEVQSTIFQSIQSYTTVQHYLKCSILKAFRQKLANQKSQLFLNNITINYIHDKFIRDNGENFYNVKRGWFDSIYRKVVDAFSKTKNIKLQELAINSFNCMYQNQKLDKISKLHNFKDYKDKYYTNVHAQIISLSQKYKNDQKKAKQEIEKVHENEKNKIHKQIQSFTEAQLEEFINIKSQLVTQSDQIFVLFLAYLKNIKSLSKVGNVAKFGFEQNGQFLKDMKLSEEANKNKQSKEQTSMQDCLHNLSYEQILQLWNNFFKNDPNQIEISAETLVKNYLQWELGNNVYYILEGKQQPSIKFIEDIIKSSAIKPNPSDTRLLNSIKAQLQSAYDSPLNNNQIQERINIIRKKLASVFITHKKGFTKKAQNNPLSQWIHEKSEQGMKKYLYTKRTTVINVYEVDRVVFLIRQIFSLAKSQSQILNLLKDTLFANTSQFLFNIVSKKFYQPNQDEKLCQQIAKHVQTYYEGCAAQIFDQFKRRNPTNISGPLKISQEQFIESIILYQQKLLSTKLQRPQHQKIFNKSLQREPIDFLFFYDCISNAMKQIEFQMNNKTLEKSLLKQVQRQNKGKQSQNSLEKQYSNPLLRKYKRCKEDYVFLGRFLKNLTLIEAYRLNRCTPILDIKRMIEKQINQMQGKEEIIDFCLWKKNALSKIIKYFGELSSFPVENTKQQRDFIFLIKNLLENLNRSKRTILISQYLDLDKEKDKLRNDFEQISSVLKTFIEKIQNKDSEKIDENLKKHCFPYQVHMIQTISINKNIIDFRGLFLPLIDQFNAKYQCLIDKKKYEFEESDLDELFFLDLDFFKCVSKLEKNILYENKKHFPKYKSRKFELSIHSIDREFLTDSVQLKITNQFYEVINRQIDTQTKNKARNNPTNLISEALVKISTKQQNQGKVINETDTQISSFTKQSKSPDSSNPYESIVIAKESSQQYQEEDKAKQLQIHLVLEGHGQSHLYFEDYAKILRKTLSMISFQSSEINPLRMDITAITSSNFHSVFGFLYALGMKTHEIRKEMAKIRSIARVYERNINETFDKHKWASCTPAQTKQCMQNLWEDNLSTFQDFKSRFNSGVDISYEANRMKEIYMAQNEQTIQYCEKILQNLADLVSQQISQEVYEERKATLNKQLGLKYECSQNSSHDYSEKNKTSTEYVQKISGMFFRMFSSLAEMIVTENPLLKTVVQITEENRTEIWKGIIIKKLFSTYKLKDYIQQKLQEKKIGRSTTLQQFYMVSNRKVLLTFTAVNVSSNRLQFINKNTYPNMPVWAAILAASSMPFLYPDFQAVKQWAIHTTKQSCIKSLKNAFFETEDDKKPKQLKFSSANIISSIPLDLLTNQTVLNCMFSSEQKKSKDEANEYIFVPITFNTLEFVSKKKNNQLTKHFITGKSIDIKWDLVKLLVKGSGTVCSSNAHKNNLTQLSTMDMIKSKISKIIGFSSSLSIMGLFVDSNDNFIMQLYKDKLIKCPIKIDTLDFHEITYKQKGLEMPTDKTLETIERSKFITKEFIKEGECSEKKIHFRIEMFREGEDNGEKQKFYENKKSIKCKIVFLSYSKWNKSEEKLLKIQYSTKGDPKKKIDCTQEIVLSVDNSLWINLDFYYPDSMSTKIIHNQLQLYLGPLYYQYKRSIQQEQPTSKLIRYDYEFKYGNIIYENEEQKILKPVKKYRERIIYREVAKLEGFLLLFSDFKSIYNSKELYGFKSQLRKNLQMDIENQNSFKSHSQPTTTKLCLTCLCGDFLHLELGMELVSRRANNQLAKNKWRCAIDDDPVCKLACPSCPKSYCLKCLKNFVIQRLRYKNKCLICSYSGHEAFYQPISEHPKKEASVEKLEGIRADWSNMNISLRDCSFCGKLKQCSSLSGCRKCNITICNVCIEEI